LSLFDVPAAWAECCCDNKPISKTGNEFADDIMVPMNRLEGDNLPVSTFNKGMEDGTFPSGTAAYEKRGIAINVPEWQMLPSVSSATSAPSFARMLLSVLF
jgi:pyruvate-ferredoxin/flavodoxin oxidoreductase